MKQVTGVLKMLGSGSTTHGNVGSSFVKYNTIEIGNKILQKVVTAQSLDDFLSRGLGQEVTLYLNKNMVIGVKLHNGQIYYWKRSLGLFLAIIILTIFLLGFATVIGGMANNFSIPLLVAILIVYFVCGPHIMQKLIYEPKLSSAGGISLKG